MSDLPLPSNATAGDSTKGPVAHVVDVVEQPLVLTALAILAALVDIVSHSPTLLIVGLLVLLGFHRSRKLAGRDLWRIQVPSYVVLFVLVSAILFGVHVLLKRSTSQFLDEIVAKVRAVMPERKPEPVTGAGSQQPATTPIAPRSYLVFDGTVRFPERRNEKGQLLPDQNVQVGDQLAFNYYWKASGPNPVTMLNSVRWLYLEPDVGEETQEQMIADFKMKIRKAQKEPLFRSQPPNILNPADQSVFNTVFAWTDDSKNYKAYLVTQSDLDALHMGKKIAFVMVEIMYLDNNELHHLRACQYLQPPATFPGIWHYCIGFTNPD